MKYVTDTHSLVWYFLEDSRLSVNALQAIDGTLSNGEIIVPTVVLAKSCLFQGKVGYRYRFKRRLRGLKSMKILQ
jgi:predicted nucleic-acid-binding protein